MHLPGVLLHRLRNATSSGKGSRRTGLANRAAGILEQGRQCLAPFHSRPKALERTTLPEQRRTAEVDGKTRCYNLLWGSTAYGNRVRGSGSRSCINLAGVATEMGGVPVLMV